jgi:hypothetical protein
LEFEKFISISTWLIEIVAGDLYDFSLFLTPKITVP